MGGSSTARAIKLVTRHCCMPLCLARFGKKSNRRQRNESKAQQPNRLVAGCAAVFCEGIGYPRGNSDRGFRSVPRGGAARVHDFSIGDVAHGERRLVGLAGLGIPGGLLRVYPWDTHIADCISDSCNLAKGILRKQMNTRDDTRISKQDAMEAKGTVGDGRRGRGASSASVRLCK